MTQLTDDVVVFLKAGKRGNAPVIQRQVIKRVIPAGSQLIPAGGLPQHPTQPPPKVKKVMIPPMIRKTVAMAGQPKTVAVSGHQVVKAGTSQVPLVDVNAFHIETIRQPDGSHIQVLKQPAGHIMKQIKGAPGSTKQFQLVTTGPSGPGGKDPLALAMAAINPPKFGQGSTIQLAAPAIRSTTSAIQLPKAPVPINEISPKLPRSPIRIAELPRAPIQITKMVPRISPAEINSKLPKSPVPMAQIRGLGSAGATTTTMAKSKTPIKVVAIGGSTQLAAKKTATSRVASTNLPTSAKAPQPQQLQQHSVSNPKPVIPSTVPDDFLEDDSAAEQSNGSSKNNEQTSGGSGKGKKGSGGKPQTAARSSTRAKKGQPTTTTTATGTRKRSADEDRYCIGIIFFFHKKSLNLSTL